PHQAVPLQVADRGPGGVAPHRFALEGNGLAALQDDRIRLDAADTHFRPLDVQQDADGAPLRGRGLAQPLDALALLLQGAVGKIEPGDIHPGGDQFFEESVAGGSNGADDLGASQSVPSMVRAPAPAAVRATVPAGAGCGPRAPGLPSVSRLPAPG